mgnify:FL=1
MAEEKIFTPDFSMSKDLLDRLKEAGRPRDTGQGFDAIIGLGKDAIEIGQSEDAQASLDAIKKGIAERRDAKYQKAKKEIGNPEMDENYLKDRPNPSSTPEPNPNEIPNTFATPTAFPMLGEVEQPVENEPPVESIDDLINNGFGRGFKAMNKRNSTMGKSVYEDFIPLIKQKQDAFIEAQGTDASTLTELAGLSEVSGNLQSWKNTLEEAAKVDAGVGWSEDLLPYEKFLLDEMAGQYSTVPSLDENNVLGFDIPMPDGSTKRVLEEDISNILNNKISPKGRELDFMKENAKLFESGQNGGHFDFDVQFKINKNNITPENVGSYMKDTWAGRFTFLQEAEEDPRFRDLNTTAADVYAQASPEDTMNEVAEWVTRKQEAEFEKGVNKKKEADNSNPGASQMTAAETIEYVKGTSYYKNLA